MRAIFLLPIIFITEIAFASTVNFWTGPVRVDAGRANTYTATMHTRFSDISGNYQENGQYYFSDRVNSFGFREALDPTQEIVFCNGSETDFTSTFLAAAANSRQNEYTEASSDPIQASKDMLINYDSSNFGPSPVSVDEYIRLGLINNSTSNAKGRFCYDMADNADRVNYRNAQAAQEVYCEDSQTHTYTDSVSGFSCTLELDLPLKVGETRFIRQLQGTGSTVAQGFLGCYQNPTTRRAEMVAVENPSTCSPSNRSTCTKTCDWADEVVCDPKDMPRWGAGRCGGIGTLIFKGDVIDVNSNNGLSFDPATGTTYQGTASMACQKIGGASAEWVVINSTCAAVPSP